MMSIPSSALILVAIVPNQRDLDIVRLLGWYRIPLKNAPKVISVDYLAFYQTSAFSQEERWKINYIASVGGHELTTRAELFHDETDHQRAREEYFKLQLGTLEKLPNAIDAGKWRRVTFLYTTGERINKAKFITDLTVHDEERTVLWASLRERALSAHEYNAEQLPMFPDSTAILAMFGLTQSKR